MSDVRPGSRLSAQSRRPVSLGPSVLLRPSRLALFTGAPAMLRGAADEGRVPWERHHDGTLNHRAAWMHCSR